MDVKMSDGVIVRFPEDTPLSEIKTQTKKYEDKIKEKLNNEKELDDESIGIGQSIIEFGKDKANSLVTVGANTYKKYRYGMESGWKTGEALINQAFANLAGIGLNFTGGDKQKARAIDFDPSKEDSKFNAILMDFYDANKDREERLKEEAKIAQEKTGGGFTASVIQGLSQTPAVVALYTPATLLTRSPAGGFALTNMLLESERKKGETDLEYAQRVGFAGVEGAISGKFLQLLNQFKIPTRITGMAAMGAAGPAENSEQRIANATTFGLLGIFGPKLANQSKLDLAVETVGFKAKQFMDQQINIAKAEKATRDVHKSLGAVIDQYTLYDKQIANLTKINVKLNKSKDRTKDTEQKNIILENIKNNESTIKSINAEKGKLKTAMDNLSAVLRDNELFATKFMRDYDMVSALTPTEARLLLVKGVEAVVEKRRKNKETGKFEKKQETVTQLRRNAKNMQRGKHESQFKNIIDAMGLGFRKYVVPAKFLGDYPVAKYGVDLVSRYAMEANYFTKLFLENPQAFKTTVEQGKIKGFNPLKYTNLVPTEGIGLTAWEKLPFESQVKVVDMMAKLDAEYTLHRKLSKDERAKDTRFDNKSGEATASYIETFKLNSAELKARNDIQKSFDALVKFYNTNVVNYGTNLTKINRRPNYFPRIYLGEYKVFVNNAKGDLLGVYGAANLRQANAIRKKLLSEGELQVEPGVFLQPKDLVINIRSKETSQMKDISIDVFQDVMNLVVRNKSNKKAIDALDKAVYNLYLQRGFNVRKLKRTGKQVEGYLGTVGNPRQRVKEFREAITNYINGGVKSGLRIKLSHDFTSFFNTPIGKGKDGNFLMDSRGRKTIADLYPEDFRFANMFKDNAVGLPINSFVKGMRQIPEGAAIEASVSKWYGRTANVANTFFLLALNARFIMLQGIQPLQMIPHKLAGMTVEMRGGSMIDATTHAYHSTALGMMRTLAPKQFNIDLAKSAVRQGVITEAMIKEFLGETYLAQGKINSRAAGKKALNIINGKMPVGFMEKFTRLQAVNIIGEHMLSLGHSKEFVIKQAPVIANQRMAEYNAYVRPLLFNIGGAITRPAGLFKTWAHNWYGQMLEAVQKAEFKKLTVGKSKLPIPIPKGQTTQLANFIASQAFFGGLKGVVGVTFVDAAIKFANNLGLTDNIPTLSDVLIKLGVPDVFIFGAPSTVLQADMSNSLQAPTTDPTEIISFPSFEFAYEAFPALLELTGYYTQYKLGQQLSGKPLGDYIPPAPNKIRDAWKKVTPTSIHGWIESWYQAHDNPYYIDNKTYGIIREERDWFVRKFYAMRSLPEVKKRLFIYRMKKEASREATSKSDLIELGVGIILKFDGDLTMLPGWYWDAVKAKGFENPNEVIAALKRMMNNVTSEPLEQMKKGGVTQEEQEIYDKAIEFGIVGYD